MEPKPPGPTVFGCGKVGFNFIELYVPNGFLVGGWCHLLVWEKVDGFPEAHDFLALPWQFDPSRSSQPFRSGDTLVA